MLVFLGSTNPVKRRAVEACLGADARIVARAVPSGVRAQPIGLDEIYSGARARAVLDGADLAVGIEDGVFERPGGGAWMNVCVACVRSPRGIWFGGAPAFEYPPEVARLVVDEGLDVSEALVRAGLTDDAQIGRKGGAIGLLSRGRLSRELYTRSAVEAALLLVA